MNESITSPSRSAPRSGITPTATALRLPQVMSPTAAARDPATPSTRTLAQSMRARHVTASEELAFIVERNRATHEMASETKAAVKYVTTENGMMEEILREKHRMLTNNDLAVIVGSVMHSKDGALNSSILAARRPPDMKCRKLALGAHAMLSRTPTPDPGAALARVAGASVESSSMQRMSPAQRLRASAGTADSPARISLAEHQLPGQRPPSNRIPTGRVNFEVLTSQQQVELRKTEESRRTYDRMINEFVSKQQGLSDRFADIL
uniref:Uncharacterized protein n=1 Tax=Neobodo designis TaxID=312471 RepID=A0A7S1Q7K2_NEODS|mmetsp:Transcript_3332/g.10347  ORF Transcript_3332/g.10347 Transcript_3332/m.10347 type:complete len:265 (+) Transcript_3332:35-829(+)